MINLTKLGKQRYESFRPLWERNPVETRLFLTCEELYSEVRALLKEQMCEKGKVCTLFGVIERSYELSEFFELGFSSINVVEDYTYEKLIERFERMITKEQLVAFGLRFEPHYLSEERTHFIMICND